MLRRPQVGVPAASSVASGCEVPSLRTREDVRRFAMLQYYFLGVGVEILSMPGLNVSVWSLKPSVS
jgi:hypothetical protein